MNSTGDNFEELRRLLAVKKHERPPPHYFQDLSQQIIDRLYDQPERPENWWQRFLSELDAKPVLAWTCSMGVAGLVLAGFVAAHSFEADASGWMERNANWALMDPTAVLTAKVPHAPAEPALRGFAEAGGGLSLSPARYLRGDRVFWAEPVRTTFRGD